MKEVVKEMLKHPIASMFIISAVGSAVAGIVREIKGSPKSPVVGLNIGEETAKRLVSKLKERKEVPNQEVTEMIEEVKEEQTEP